MDNIPYMKLSYANGPGYDVHKNPTSRDRIDPTGKTFKVNDFEFRAPATTPDGYESHGGDDVVVFAAGPHSHMFTGRCVFKKN